MSAVLEPAARPSDPQHVSVAVRRPNHRMAFEPCTSIIVHLLHRAQHFIVAVRDSSSDGHALRAALASVATSARGGP